MSDDVRNHRVECPGAAGESAVKLCDTSSRQVSRRGLSPSVSFRVIRRENRSVEGRVEGGGGPDEYPDRPGLPRAQIVLALGLNVRNEHGHPGRRRRRQPPSEESRAFSELPSFHPGGAAPLKGGEWERADELTLSGVSVARAGRP